MEYTHLGRTGLQVSRLVLGTMNFTDFTDEADSFAIMDKALEVGVNFFDTANVYGKPWATGATESLIGRWLAQGNGRRDRIVLATKVYDEMGQRPNEWRLSAYHIRRACDDSLRRLKTDYIDVYQMHHIDRFSPWEEIWQAMEQLTQAGKIIYVGSSNFAGWHIAQANEAASARHFMGLVSEQSPYSLNNRAVEAEVIPACRAYGMGLIPYSPLSSGLLAGALRKFSEGRRATDEMQGSIKEEQSRLEAYEALCSEIGEEPANVALAWLLHNPIVAAPIIGPRTLDQFVSSLRAPEIELSPDVLKRLDAIWPGPGGEAPEVYAW